MFIIRELLFLCLLSSFILAVTIIPSTLTLPRPYINTTKPAASSEALFRNILRTTDKVGVFANSAPDLWRSGEGEIYASQDSFLRGFIDAGVQHQHLEIRPEDVWFTILAQMSFWLQRFERLDDPRAKAPKGHLWAEYTWGMEKMIEDELKSKDKTNWLRWSRTNFSTKGWSDGTIANALLLASSIPIPHGASEDIAPFGEIGIPSITLSGAEKD